MSVSEIRVNTTKTRTGVGTITYTETGPVITGIATASNFKTGSTNVHSTGVELANINTGGSTATFGGPISGTTASFSGTVSIGGTLTYEDVTNIDSVGVITARNGIYLDKFVYHSGDLNTSFGFPNDATDTFVVNTNSTEKLRIDSSGNIGQGTDTPTIPDGSNADNPLNGTPIFTMYGDSPAINLVSSTTASSDWSSINFGRTGSSTNPYRAVIGYHQSADLLRINAKNSIAFDTGGDINSGERLCITSAGKIGIGTDTVTDTYTQIEIVGSATAKTRIQFDNKPVKTADNDELGGFIVRNNTDSVGYILCKRESAVDDAYLSFGTQATGAGILERLRIKSNGQVRIQSAGTNNVPAKLQIHHEDTSIASGDHIGEIRFTGRDSAGAGTEKTGALIDVTAAADWNTGATGYYPSNIDFHTQSNSGTDTVAAGPRMRIDSNGSLLINSTSNNGASNSGQTPVLYANGYSNLGGLRIKGGDDGNTIYKEGGDLSIVTGDATSIILKTNGGEQIKANNDGRVITTTNQSVVGLIVKNSTHDSRLQIYAEAANKNSTIWFGDAADDDIGIIDYDHNNNSLAFTVNTNERLRIDSIGRIGCGDEAANNRTGHAFQISDLSGGTSYQLLSLQNHNNSNNTHMDIGFYAQNANSATVEYARIEGTAVGTYANSNQEGAIKMYTNKAGTMGEVFKIDKYGRTWATGSYSGDKIHYWKNMDTTSGSSSMSVQHHFNFNRTGGGVDLSAARLVAGKEREWVGGAANQDGYLAFHTAQNESSQEKMRIESTGRLTMNTPGSVASQYVTYSKAVDGNYTNFRVTVTATSWHSFFLKMYVSGYSGQTAHRWVTGYCNNGFGTIRTVLANDSGNFGSGSITHISGQSWRYDISINSSHATHPVMFVELAIGGNGHVRNPGAVALSIT